MDLHRFEEGVEYNDHYVGVALVDPQGCYQGGIMLVRGEDDTTWGEVRQSWIWVVLGAEADLLGRSKSHWERIKSGVDANPHPLELLGSMLHFMAAGVEARNRPDSENRDLFPEAVTEWAYMNDTQLQELDCSIDAARDAGMLDWPAGA